MNNRSNRVCVCGLTTFSLVAGLSIASFAAPIVPIPVTNGSFEQPDLANLTDGYPSNQVAAGGSQSTWLYTTQMATVNNKPHYYGPNSVNDAIPYWSVTSNGANTGMTYGVGDPVSTMYFGTNGGTGGGFGLTANTNQTFSALNAINSSYGYSFANGYQFGYANLGAGGSTTLIYNPSDPNSGGAAGLSLGNFSPGSVYTLSVGIGTARTESSYSYAITLLESMDGGSTWSPVGAGASGAAPEDASGTWEQAAYSFTAGAGDTGLIGIQLTMTNNGSISTRADFDNVQINAIGGSLGPPVSPEPTSLGLLAIGAVGLIRRRR